MCSALFLDFGTLPKLPIATVFNKIQPLKGLLQDFSVSVEFLNASARRLIRAGEVSVTIQTEDVRP